MDNDEIMEGLDRFEELLNRYKCISDEVYNRANQETMAVDNYVEKLRRHIKLDCLYTFVTDNGQATTMKVVDFDGCFVVGVNMREFTTWLDLRRVTQMSRIGVCSCGCGCESEVHRGK